MKNTANVFSFNFPLTVNLPDGTSVTANSEEELFTAVDAYYEANPESDEDPSLAYPIEVTLEDGSTQTINSDEELDALLEACFGECDGLIFAGNKAALAKATAKINSNQK